MYKYGLPIFQILIRSKSFILYSLFKFQKTNSYKNHILYEFWKFTSEVGPTLNLVKINKGNVSLLKIENCTLFSLFTNLDFSSKITSSRNRTSAASPEVCLWTPY